MRNRGAHGDLVTGMQAWGVRAPGTSQVDTLFPVTGAQHGRGLTGRCGPGRSGRLAAELLFYPACKEGSPWGCKPRRGALPFLSLVGKLD